MVSSPEEADTISISPSPSISAAKTENAPSALVAISEAAQEGSAAPLFSYHAMVSSPEEADTISISPSPSISAAKTDFAVSALVAILAAVQEGSAAPLFSYQAMVLSRVEADTISISPSPSISATKTDLAPSALVAISAAAHVGSAAPLFSYHAMVSSLTEADTISISPSPSISATKTENAPFAVVAISEAAHEGSEAPLFSYQAMVLSFKEADTISISPSPSISAANTDLAVSAFVAILAAVHEGFTAPLFSYQAMVLSS